MNITSVAPALWDNEVVKRLAGIAVIFMCAVCAADFEAGLAAYEKGDYATAFKEWKELADEGHPAAQFNLALLYHDGRGVPQDFRNAFKWFERSANQGYSRAQLNLGAFYGVGKGVKRDYQQAYKWLSLCAATGNGSCGAQRDLVAKKLSGSKLGQAQQMARDWKPVPER
jgi:uncharacterized protein